MRILWVGPNFLHPTTKGGQIRTLNTLIQLHRRHDIRYVTFDHSGETEGPARAQEYCSSLVSFPLKLPKRGSLAFASQAVQGIFSNLPVSIRRFCTDEMRGYLKEAAADTSFDCVVCDFLAVADNFSNLRGVTLFEHNVETEIWRRRVSQCSNPLMRTYLQQQAKRMFAFERRVCRESEMVLAVSEKDADTMRNWFDLQPESVQSVPTGVDVDYFRRPDAPEQRVVHDLVFVGSMDWTPNEDAMIYFVEAILPLIRKTHPSCSLAIVGRSPSAAIQRLAQTVSGVTVTGTVADVRPYLWGSQLSIVPIRIGGGTRLKIYESAAAGVPVVSTTIGAEGLAMGHNEQLLLADSPGNFADCVRRMLDEPTLRQDLAEAGLALVESRFSWPAAAGRFEELLFESAERRKRRLQA